MDHTTNTQIAINGLTFSSEFAKEVYFGLSGSPKTLSSKYFYDKIGDKIFQDIMRMESYYLTRTELSIFEEYRNEILNEISNDQPFRILELGAGDGLKTKILLKHFLERGMEFNYQPIDISGNVLNHLKRELKKDLPELSILPLEGEYFQVLSKMQKQLGVRNVIFFLGSNIGNFAGDHCINFLKRIRASLQKGDILLIGFDLMKDPEIILNAYSDPEGITANFNLNLLQRINRELDANFDTSKFIHYPTYNPVNGECRSHLISSIHQQVEITELDCVFEFEKWEPIFTEVSKKYRINEISEFALKSSFKEKAVFTDPNNYFANVLWEAI